MGLATTRILGRDHRVAIAAVVRCDITSGQSVEDLFREANDGDNLRTVVHSAGVSPQMGDAGKMSAINAPSKNFAMWCSQEMAGVLACCAGARPGYLTGMDILCDLEPCGQLVGVAD